MRRLSSLTFIFILIASVLVAGCGTKDLVSLSSIDKTDFWVGDRFNNKVKIENVDDFLNAFKQAKLVNDPQGVKSESDADYVFYSKDKRIYYDSTGKYLIFLDASGKKYIYSADLTSLLSNIQDLPPAVSKGFDDAQIQTWADEFSKIKTPSAMLFDQGDKAILLVFAGEKPQAGYELTLDQVSFSNNTLTVNIRLNPPKEAAAQVISYPYAGFTISKKTDVDVRLITQSTGGENIEHVPLARVSPGQNVILLNPERGAILTERIKLSGFARVPEGTFSVEVEDGHNVLGKKQATASKGAPDWGYFEFWMDLDQATSPYGTIIFVTQSPQDGSRVEELMVPVSFGGK